ncbi:MAG TPA: hypothetical protein VFA50_20055 [Stellaceae bacterium]|nr:hypothetical protein [Stellaceae bacterium]
MIALVPKQLMLASVRNLEQVSLDWAAWAPLARNGLVSTEPLGDANGPAVIVTITDAGKAAASIMSAAREPDRE